MAAARRMVGGHDDGSETAAALAAMGLKADGPLGDADLELWADNVATINLFGDMLTQWNVGMSGAVGLRYEALPLLLDLHAATAEDRPYLMQGLRVMERAALEVMRGK